MPETKGIAGNARLSVNALAQQESSCVHADGLRKGQALKQRGVTEIEVIGTEFDEEVAEAVARFAAGADKKGLIVDVVQRGYMLGDKVLRYAKVVVGE